MAEASVEQLETQSRCSSDLPSDSLGLILSRLLFIRDRCSFRGVCKSWNTVTCSRVPRPLPPPSMDAPYYTAPCLIISERNNRWKIFHSVYNDSYYVDFPELMDAEIRCSNYGWLLLSRGDFLFFFNPFTREKMEVPQATDTFLSLSFSDPPTASDCLVFGISSRSTTSSTYFGLLYLGKGQQWEEFNYVHVHHRKFYVSSCPPIYCREDFYCVDRTGNVLVFNPAPGFESDRYTLSYNRTAKNIDQCYMAAVDGDLWGIFLNKDRGRFMSGKIDFEKLGWKLNRNLGKKCFYAGPKGSFAENSVGTGMANTIYFNKFYGESGILYTMSGMYHLSLDGDYFYGPTFGLNETGNNSAWIKPPSPPKIIVYDSSTTSDWLDWI